MLFAYSCKPFTDEENMTPFHRPRRRMPNAKLKRQQFRIVYLLASWLVIALCLVRIQYVYGFAMTSHIVSKYQCHLPHSSSSALLGIKGFRAWFETTFPNAMMSPISPSNGDHDEFDHVLVDLNQILHIVLRKARNEGHALTLLMMELDTLCRMASPTQSLVLAMDGPPAAAKVATQRRRRYSTLVRSEWKLNQLQRFRRRFDKAQFARKNRIYKSEVKTLCITPGTAFMERTEQALLYWAWQRLSHQQRHTPSASGPRTAKKGHHSSGSVLTSSQVKVYISSSSVPGEGEIKILEWILQHPQKMEGGASIAILGGDSDLVLEALTVPPKWTHNVFVLLPEGSKHFISVSTWETTRSLASQLFSSHDCISSSRDRNDDQLEVSSQMPSTKLMMDVKQLMLVQARSDFVLLVIFNGNDYLPRLRGSSGFNRVYRTYMELMKGAYKEFLMSDDNAATLSTMPGLVDTDRLEFRLEFCIDFFEQLSRLAPAQRLYKRDKLDGRTSDTNYKYSPAVAQLHNLVDSGFLPQPMKWQVSRSFDTVSSTSQSIGDTPITTPVNGNFGIATTPATEAIGEESYEDLDDEAESLLDDGAGELDEAGNDKDVSSDIVMLRLKLGIEESDDFFLYEMIHNRTTPLKQTKRLLAEAALENILEIFSDEHAKEGPADGASMITSSGYAWEVPFAVEANVEEYLTGLLWNLQTYQDGICVDYGYNYGRRQSPTAQDLVLYFKRAQAENRTVGRQELLGRTFTPPVSAGISCLAALPSQVKHLVPEPYSWIEDSKVEAFYAQSMDPGNNVFDFKNFERLCETEISAMLTRNQNDEKNRRRSFLKKDEHKGSPHGRRIILGDHFWTVLGRSKEPLMDPFDPPLPFSDRLSKLRPNKRIRASRLFATNKPRPRSVWAGGEHQTDQNSCKPERPVRHRRDVVVGEVDHAGFGSLLDGEKSVMDVDYKIAFQNGSKKRPLKRKQINSKLKQEKSKAKKQRKKKLQMEISIRMKQFQRENPPKEPTLMKDGSTAVACLKQLKDSHLISDFTWKYTNPSQTPYASFKPTEHEHVCLTIHKADSVPNLVYEQDRDINTVSRQSLKQHLASLALCDITGPQRRWSDLTFAELREFLAEERNKRDSI